jgi:peptide/nickel transport system permease protein
MGTDDLGRDVLSGVLHGARTSLIVVVCVLAIAAPIGIAVGAVSGYRGGRVDHALMRVTEVFQTIPQFFLAVIVVALFGAGIQKVVVLLGLTLWPMLARVVRAETLSVRRREFVEAARSVGLSETRIVLRHVLPNVLPSAVVVVTLLGGTVILLEAALGFIGLGDPSVMSWGYLANNAQRFLRVAWWMTVFPGAAIVLAVLGLNLFGDALSDLRNPLAGRRPLFPPLL